MQHCRALLGGGEKVHTLPDPLKSGVLNPSPWSEIKHRRTVVLDMPTARHRQVEGRDLAEAWAAGEIVCFSVMAS